VIVTRAGRKRLAQLHQVVHEVDAELRSVLSAREVHALLHGLTHVYEHFSEEVASDRS
jgi:DNA-binding MarR family transcriptional regulator